MSRPYSTSSSKESDNSNNTATVDFEDEEAGLLLEEVEEETVEYGDTAPQETSQSPGLEELLFQPLAVPHRPSATVTNAPIGATRNRSNSAPAALARISSSQAVVSEKSKGPNR